MAKQKPIELVEQVFNEANVQIGNKNNKPNPEHNTWKPRDGTKGPQVATGSRTSKDRPKT